MGYIFTAQCDDCSDSIDMGSWEAMREKMKQQGWVRKHTGRIYCDECRKVPDKVREERAARARAIWAEAGRIIREEQPNGD